MKLASGNGAHEKGRAKGSARGASPLPSPRAVDSAPQFFARSSLVLRCFFAAASRDLRRRPVDAKEFAPVALLFRKGVFGSVSGWVARGRDVSRAPGRTRKSSTPARMLVNNEQRRKRRPRRPTFSGGEKDPRLVCRSFPATCSADDNGKLTVNKVKSPFFCPSSPAGCQIGTTLGKTGFCARRRPVDNFRPQSSNGSFLPPEPLRPAQTPRTAAAGRVSPAGGAGAERWDNG